MLDILVNRVIGTRDELGARYDLALLRIHETFHDPTRDPVSGESRVRALARDFFFTGLALYEASLMKPGSASYRHTIRSSAPDNVIEFHR